MNPPKMDHKLRPNGRWNKQARQRGDEHQRHINHAEQPMGRGAFCPKYQIITSMAAGATVARCRVIISVSMVWPC